MPTVPGPKPAYILNARLTDRAERQGTVRDYLTELLAGVWNEEADSKYGLTGESDWRYDIYYVLVELELITPWLDGWGITYPADGSERDIDRQHKADWLITEAIRALVAP